MDVKKVVFLMMSQGYQSLFLKGNNFLASKDHRDYTLTSLCLCISSEKKIARLLQQAKDIKVKFETIY